MLDPAEARDVAARFGVADAQVRRDHLISHLLAALGRELTDELIFFGGTALARTHLPDGRLSEDIDLLATGSRRDTARHVDDLLAGAVRREYGRLAWVPSLSSLPRDTGAATLRTDDGLTVRVQLLTGAGYPRWPTEERDLVQRYSDAPPGRLRVPTLPAFGADKTVTWLDRHAPRDLYDLWGLAGAGAITAGTASLYAEVGPGGRPHLDVSGLPDAARWHNELAGQTRIAVDPPTALAAVRAAWASALGSGPLRTG